MLETLADGKKFFNAHDVKVYNATIGGKLDVFPRKEFMSLFEISKEDELSLFLKKFNIPRNTSYNLIDYFDNAIVVNNVGEWDNERRFAICNTEIALKLIPEVIYDYIPYGPIFDQYIFIKRKNLTE